jgi:hypothetical protein
MIPPTVLRFCGNVFTESLPNNSRGILRPTDSFDTARTTQKTACPTFSLFSCIFVAAGTYLPSCCLVTIRVQTQRLVGGIYEVHGWDGLRCRNIHTKFHKDWFRHLNIDGDTQTARWSHKPTLFFYFLMRKVGYKIMLLYLCKIWGSCSSDC